VVLESPGKVLEIFVTKIVGTLIPEHVMENPREIS